MKTLHVLALSLSVTALGLATPAPASATVVVDQHFETTADPNKSTGVGFVGPTLAQTFAVGVTGTLAELEISVLKHSGTTGDLTVDIRALVSGGAPDPLAANALGSFVLSNADIAVSPNLPPYGFAPVSIDLTPANIAVTAGQMLAFVVTTTIGETFSVQTDYTAGYAAGTRWSQAGDGAPFDSGNPDLTFTTYVDTAAVPEPGTLGLFLAGLAGLGYAVRQRGDAPRA